MRDLFLKGSPLLKAILASILFVMSPGESISQSCGLNLSSPAPACLSGTSTMTFTGGIGGNSYQLIDASNPSSPISTFTFINSPPYYQFQGAIGKTYYVRATSNHACASQSRTVTQIPTSNLSITTQNGKSPQMCQGESITLIANGGDGYSWTTPSGTFYGNTLPLNQPGSMRVYLYGSNAPPCTGSANSAYIDLVVGQQAQPFSIGGPGTVCGGDVKQYTASSTNATSYVWSVIPSNAGTPQSTSTGTANVTWSKTYSGPAKVKVNAYSGTGCSHVETQEQNVTVNWTPATPIVSNINLAYGSTNNITASGALPGETYQWFYTTGTGNSVWATGSPVSIGPLLDTLSYTYTVGGFNPTTGCKTAPTDRATMLIGIYVEAAPVPEISANTCLDRVVSFSPATPGTTYYLQTSSTGTSTSTPIGTTVSFPSNGTHYVRAKANSLNLWGAAVEFSAFVNPVDLEMSKYELANKNARATHSITLKPGFNTAGNDFTARIVITQECNDQINWREEIVYSQAGDTISDSRTYYNGFGVDLQTQSKDFLNKKIFGTQTLVNSYWQAVGGSLPGPILENQFIYKSSLIYNAGHQPYTHTDFDLRSPVGGNGHVYLPNAVGNDPGTIGWYYSNLNNLEPKTPTTSFPYSRSYTPEGPDPTSSVSTGVGDPFRMGQGHEVKSEKVRIESTDPILDHYYSIRPHFISEPLTANSNLITGFNTQTPTNIVTTSGAVVSANNGYIDLDASSNGTLGAYFGGDIPVTSLKRYVFSVKGLARTGAAPKLRVKYKVSGSDVDILWPGPTTWSHKEDWTTVVFLVPAGVTSVNVGVVYNGNAVAFSSRYSISEVSLRAAVPVNKGYKYLITDPDGKQVVSFTDPDLNDIASAVVQSGSYDVWSYTFYNNAGQVVASVDPKDVITTDFSKPIATTFRYDHLGRLINSTSPDEGTSQFVYAKDGRLRFSQSALQKTAIPERFSYTNYDVNGRPIESGEYSSNTSIANPYYFEPDTVITPKTGSVISILENIGFTGTSKAVDSRCSDWSTLTYDVQPFGAPATQEFLTGRVSKTDNVNTATWYSYDEFGDIAWTIQGLPDLGNKRIDYTYDYFGNVTQVAYQAGQPDQFYHHYEYDMLNRLVRAYTSFDGINKTLHAKYIYYLHGPLKRVELATNLQGIDYVYNIDGSLKSINDATVAKDPGADGTNGFSQDIFGETLNYFSGDYNGADNSTGTIVNNVSAANSYTGNIKYQAWFTPVDNGASKKVYGYNYDNLNRLQSAQFGNITGGFGSYNMSSSTSYAENNLTYDKNGNIKTLTRSGANGSTIANYNYNYTAGKNQLATINGSPSNISYTYDAIGQMTHQTEGSNTLQVFYDVAGQVQTVFKNSSSLITSYFYDDRGNMFKRSETMGATTNSVFNVSDVNGNVMAVYEKLGAGSIVLKELPIYAGSRIGIYKPVSNKTFYEIGDHLGNVRAVIGPPSTEIINATMETEVMGAEDAAFKNIAPRVVWVNGTVTPPAVAGNEAVRLNNARPTGPAIILKVSPGDVISAEVYAYYEGCSDCNNNLSAAAIVTSVAGAFGGVSGAAGESGRIYNAVNGALGSGGGGGSGNPLLPNASINLIMFNNNIDPPVPTVLPMAATNISTAANMQKEKIMIAPITIPSPGYVYIYLNNASNSSTFVYFDDFKITHVHSPYVAGSDYYPFGLSMSDREILQEPYRYGYQGQYSEENNSLGWNEFELRMYDPRIGRWISPDPYGQFASPYIGMGNNPVNMVDADGGFTDPVKTIVINGVESVLLDEVIVTASRWGAVQAGLNIMHNELTPSLTFEQYQSKYREFKGMSGEEASAYWDEKYRSDFESQWNEAVRVEKVIRAQEILDNAETYMTATLGLKSGGFRPKLKPGTMAARVIKVPSKATLTIDKVFEKPSLLRGRSLQYVRTKLTGNSNWFEGTLKHGRSKGHGWTFRELNDAGKETDRYIQYHPGTRHHFGGRPYWKVSSGKGGTQRFQAD